MGCGKSGRGAWGGGWFGAGLRDAGAFAADFACESERFFRPKNRQKPWENAEKAGAAKEILKNVTLWLLKNVTLADNLTCVVERETQTTNGELEMSSYTVIEISANGSWAGSGKLIDGRIEDCAANFCNDDSESLKVYELIEKAIAEGENAISIQLAGYINLNIDWVITEPAVDDISDELREEITDAVLAADVCCEESVCDACIAVAKSGGDWRAELAKAIANDSAERKTLGVN